MKENISQYFIEIIIIIALTTIICFILRYAVRKIYFKLQNLYIKKSGDKHMIYEKLLVTNYNVYNCLETFFNFINPIKIYDEYHKTYFDIKIFSYSFRDTIKAISIYGIILFIIKTITKNYNNILNFLQKQHNINYIEIIKTALINLYENKWYILACLSVVSIIYGIYKSKFTNKIVEELQDNELKEIIGLYKNISLELINLEMLLLKNIKTMLVTHKKDGVFVFLYNAIENRTDFCKYDYSKNILIVKENRFTDSGLGVANINLNDINQSLDNIKTAFDNYYKEGHFYNPCAINKYFKGLNQFNIEFFVKYPQLLIDEKHINNMIDSIVKDCNLMINDDEDSRKFAVDKLNEKVKEKNDILYIAIRESIEKVIQIDKFNKQLRKSMSLKKYRDKFSIDSFISNMK
ncbi:MAG: hypothetical protein MR823_04935 [Ruminococcus sp.]|nr:hypothetical protein [Ruminococcus sp.]